MGQREIQLRSFGHVEGVAHPPVRKTGNVSTYCQVPEFRQCITTETHISS